MSLIMARPQNNRSKPVRENPRTPQKEVEAESSKIYVGIMLGLFAIGSLLIILNYIGAFPGGSSSWWFVGGLGLIGAGFGMMLNFK